LDPHQKLKPHETTDTSAWSTQLESLNPPPQIFISALGTTRGQAGSVEKQRVIDYDLNLSLAKAAQKAGVKVYVLVSTGMADSSSRAPYLKMKGELEDAVSKLDFEKVVILRPGLLLGHREDSRPPEYAFRMIALGLSKISKSYFFDTWVNPADEVGKAAVAAALECVEKTAPAGKVWTLGISDIVRLGRTEWKE